MNTPERPTTTPSGPWGPLTVLLIVIAIITFGSRTPSVAERIWSKPGAFPDLPAVMSEFQSSRNPLAFLARRVADSAVSDARAAAEAGSREAMTAAFLSSQSKVMAAYFSMHLPVVLALAGASFAGARWAQRRGSSAPAIDEDTDVRVDLAARPPLPVPEVDLPWPAEALPPTPPVDAAALSEALRLARTHGLGAPEVDACLQALPRREGRAVRAYLDGAAGASDAGLAAYEALVKGDEGPLEALGKAERKALLRLQALSLPPAFVRVREDLRRSGHLSPLRERLLRIAAAHPRHPASIGHHGAFEGGLLLHKATVLEKAIEMVVSGAVPAEDLEAILTLAAAHDDGKFLSFAEDGDKFERLDDRHAANTARILAACPEFEAEHGEDAERIHLALAFEHDRSLAGIPVHLRSACWRVMRLMKSIDGDATVAELATTPAPSEADALRHAVDIFPKAVRYLVVNRRGRHGHGFYDAAGPRGEEVFFVSELQVRRVLRALLSDPDQQALGLWRERVRGRVHPGFAALAAKLLEMGAIPRTVRGVTVEASYSGLMTIRVEKTVFRGMAPLSISWLRQEMEAFSEVYDYWQAGDPCELEVLKAGWHMSQEALQTKDRESREAAVASVGRCPACERPMKLTRENSHIACKNFYLPKADPKRCEVRFKLTPEKQPIRDCAQCGKPLEVVPRGKNPAFMGCPDRCNQKKGKGSSPKSNGDAKGTTAPSSDINAGGSEGAPPVGGEAAESTT